METKRPTVLIAEQFVNVIRLGDQGMMRDWVEEMADNVLILKDIDGVLFGFFSDESVVCVPRQEGVPWYCGGFDRFSRYLEEVPNFLSRLLSYLMHQESTGDL